MTIATDTASLTSADYLRAKFEAGLDYDAYLAAGKPDQKVGWEKIGEQLVLPEPCKNMLGGFVREFHVLMVSGIWCGDCVRQGPMIQAIADATIGKARVKWLDRDEHMDLQRLVTVNAGNRVPMAIFAAEDFELVSVMGDKPLSRYRVMAEQALGANCPLPGAPVPPEHLAAELQEWTNEFERVHLLLRLSGRLRQKHND
ncbi:MAG: thioredoxin family protein [Planctomycetota bacterium]